MYQRPNKVRDRNGLVAAGPGISFGVSWRQPPLSAAESSGCGPRASGELGTHTYAVSLRRQPRKRSCRGSKARSIRSDQRCFARQGVGLQDERRWNFFVIAAVLIYEEP